jgi:hypothetical protein
MFVVTAEAYPSVAKHQKCLILDLLYQDFLSKRHICESHFPAYLVGQFLKISHLEKCC